jgi:hypothetical protein
MGPISQFFSQDSWTEEKSHSPDFSGNLPFGSKHDKQLWIYAPLQMARGALP